MLHRYLGTRIKRKHHEIDPEDVFLDSHNIPTFNTNQLEGRIERPLPSFVSYIMLVSVIAVFGTFAVKMYAMQIRNVPSRQSRNGKGNTSIKI